MATVEAYDTKDGKRYRVRYRKPDGGTTSKRGFATKKAAEAFGNRVEVKKVDGEYVDPSRGRTTVGELAEQWFRGKVKLKESTRNRYRSTLDNQILPKWKHTAVAKVDEEAIQEWIVEMLSAPDDDGPGEEEDDSAEGKTGKKEGLSASSVLKAHSGLSMILAMAVRDKRIPRNPAKGLDLPRIVAQKKIYLNARQVWDLADKAGRGRLIVLTLAYTGIRWGEMAALRVEKVNLEKRRLRIDEAVSDIDGKLVVGTPKTHAERTVPLPRFLAAEFKKHLQGRKHGDLVFTDTSGQLLRNQNARRDWFDDAVAEAGIPKITPHELRHTAASLAVSAGANVKALQRMLGHAKASQTLDRYADLFDDDLDQVADRLDVIAFPGTKPAASSPAEPCELCPKCVHESQPKTRKPRGPKKVAA